MRVLTLLALLATATAARAQGPIAPPPASPLPLGARLRLETTTSPSPVFGRLVVLEDGAIVLQNDDGPHAGEPAGLVDQVRVPVSSVQHAYVRDGHEQRAHAAVRGAAYGALLGAVFAVAQNVYISAVERSDDLAVGDPHSFGDFWSLKNVHMRFDVAMIPAGAIVGALRAHPHWSEVSLGGAR